MSYIFDHNYSLIYLLTDRNQIFRYHINQSTTNIDLDEKHIYGFHAYSILSIGLCSHKPWLITLGGDNWIKIFDYKDNDREIVSKYIPDGAYAVTGRKNFLLKYFIIYLLILKDRIHMVFIYV